jgi:hypothetical protein
VRAIRRLIVLLCLSLPVAMLVSTPAEAQLGRRLYPFESAARIQVEPRHTEVYVDGYLAGTVDDFDGIAQRLRLPAGEHVVELYLEGHRTIRELIFFQPGETYRIRHKMEPVAVGETPSPRPSPATSATGAPSPPPRPGSSGPYGQGPRDPRDRTLPGQGAGTIAVRVQPGDAVVLIDGERWDSSGAGARLDVQVNPGPHRIEVQKDGYQPFSSTVQVRAGETTAVNVSLTPKG